MKSRSIFAAVISIFTAASAWAAAPITGVEPIKIAPSVRVSIPQVQLSAPVNLSVPGLLALPVENLAPVLPDMAPAPALAEQIGQFEAAVQDFAAGKVENAAQGLDGVYDKNLPAKPSGDVSGVLAPSHFVPLAASQPAWSKGVFLPKTIDKPLPGDALGVTVHRLSNGMSVYLSPNKQEPRVRYEIAVRAGSRHDPLEATGMAHYLEHMQFKGTARLGTMDYAKEKPHLDKIEKLYDRLFLTKEPEARKKIYAEIDAESQLAARYASPNEFDKLYSAAGFTEINAHTNYEETVYEGSFPANKADVWARVEADRLTDPVYRIFLPELEAVYEEYNKSVDSPDNAFYQAAFHALYQGHPYSRDVIGHAEHLKNPSISRMRQFFADFYHPNNMAIVLSGDFDRVEMLKLLEKSFGGLKPAPIPAPPAGKVEKQKGVSRVELRFQAEEAVQVDWQMPGQNHPDQDALGLAGQLVNNLLNLRVNKTQKVKQAGGYQQFLNEAGGWLFIAEAKEGQTLEQAEGILMEQVKRLKAGDFAEDDLKTAITQIEVAEKKRLEKNEARAGLITESFIAGTEWQAAAGALERVKSVTKADILRVINLYLGEDRVVVYRRKGTENVEKVSKPAFTSVPIDTSKQSPFFKELVSLPAEPLAPRFLKKGRDFRTLDRSWGRLYWANNPVNDLFSLEFRFDRGNAHEKRLDMALSLLQVSGAGDMDVEAFQKTLDRLGSKMSMGCGERECVVKLSGLEKNLEETVRLALLRFSAPNIAAGAFQGMIELERGDRADRKLDAGRIAQALEEFVSRGKDSEFLKELTPAELDALTEKDLKRVLASVFQYRRDAAYSGRRKPGEIAGVLDAAQDRRNYRKPPVSAPRRLLRPEKPRVVFVHKEGMKQARIGAYAADGSYDPKRRLDYRLYNSVMGGGMGGIYFQEVRESRALAYTAGGGYKPADRPGDDNSVFSSAGTQADKAVQTARLLRELMLKPPVTPERYGVSRSQVEGAFRSEAAPFDEIPARVRTWERMGFKEDPRIGSFKDLAAYSAGKLDEFTARFKGKPLTFFVVGDRNSVDVEGLKALGDFEERGVDELFPY